MSVLSNQQRETFGFFTRLCERLSPGDVRFKNEVVLALTESQGHYEKAFEVIDRKVTRAPQDPPAAGAGEGVPAARRVDQIDEKEFIAMITNPTI